MSSQGRNLSDLSTVELLQMQRQIIDELGVRALGGGTALSAEREPPRLWPRPVFEAAINAFGGAVFNEAGRTFRSLDRRIGHAMTVWGDKYGPLNAAQEEYATSVLVGVLNGSVDAAIQGGESLYAIALHRLESCVNHERVDEGFKTRRAEARLLDDVGELVAEPAA